MPFILPTPEELQRMGWREREIARVRAIRLLNSVTALQQVPVGAAQETAADWAEAVRAEARRLQAITPADPMAREHRLALLEATR